MDWWEITFIFGVCCCLDFLFLRPRKVGVLRINLFNNPVPVQHGRARTKLLLTVNCIIHCCIITTSPMSALG